MQLPADVTQEEFDAALASDDIPSFFFEIVFAGGVTANPGEQTQGVLELTPGTWLIANIDQLGIAPLTLTVTGEAPVEPVTIESAHVVHLTSYGFDFPDSIASGEQVWEVTNTEPGFPPYRHSESRQAIYLRRGNSGPGKPANPRLL